MTNNLVVADESRTDKTICLAVSPSLKAYGVGGRARLFEVQQRVRQVNAERILKAPDHRFVGKSAFDPDLQAHPELALDFIIAMPRMALYIKYSTTIYSIYLKYVAPEDIHVYSIDEVFMDVTGYLKTYRKTAHELAMEMIQDVLRTTGITATAGIGTNLYLCKVAMDIVAKHIPADKDGVRIAELDEESYRRLLWNHRPLTAFWRVGPGIARRLETLGITTMGQLARFSTHSDEVLYKMFGVNAELLIDHAWGWEPCTIDKIKAYRPETNSLSSGQVLTCAYTMAKARVVIQEMADSISLDLVDKRLVTDQIVVSIGYDRESLTRPEIRDKYTGEIHMDYYGRAVPKPANGSIRLAEPTSSTRLITEAVLAVFDRVVNPDLLIRRLNIATNHVVREGQVNQTNAPIQLDLFTDYEAEAKRKKEAQKAIARERKMQETILNIKKRFGKNAILRGLNFEEGATMRERNQQIGGHRA